MSKIINPIEEVEQAIPELETISNYNNIKYLSFQSWDNRIKAIETKNLNKYHRSTSWVSMGIYFNPCVVCIRTEGVIEINEVKYKLIRKYMMSEEFNLN